MTDPIVDEVREARARIMARCGNDLDKLVKYLQKKRKRLGLKVVRLHPERASLGRRDGVNDGEKWTGKEDLSGFGARPTHRTSTPKRRVV